MRILVADNNGSDRDVLERELTDSNEVTFVESGLDAIEHLRSQEYDIVLCALALPGATGVDVLRYCEQESQARFVFLAPAVCDAEVRTLLSDAGTPFVERPLRVGALLDLLTRLSLS